MRDRLNVVRVGRTPSVTVKVRAVGMRVRVMRESLMKILSVGVGNFAAVSSASSLSPRPWQEVHLRSQHPAANSDDEDPGPDG